MTTSHRLIVFPIVLLVLFTCVTADAQLKPNIDEEVRVYYRFEWRDGTVVQIKRNQFLVDLGFDGQEVFDRPDLRRMFEVDADRLRTELGNGGWEIQGAGRTERHN